MRAIALIKRDLTHKHRISGLSINFAFTTVH